MIQFFILFYFFLKTCNQYPSLSYIAIFLMNNWVVFTQILKAQVIKFPLIHSSLSSYFLAKNYCIFGDRINKETFFLQRGEDLRISGLTLPFNDIS